MGGRSREAGAVRAEAFSSLILAWMDVSETGPYLAALVAPVAVWAGYRLVKLIPWRWLRILGWIGLGWGTFAGGLAVVALLIVETACRIHTAPTWSPSGRHVAILTFYAQGALGADYADVSVRRRWRPVAEHVFTSAGDAPLRDGDRHSPEVRWLSDSRLLIRHGGRHVAPNRCGNWIDGVEIVCVQQD